MSFIFGWYIVQVKKVFETVEHNFPVAGHTYLVRDGDNFSVTERKTKETLAVYEPESWRNLAETAKLKNPSKAVRMALERHFASISQFTNMLNFSSKDEHDQPVHLRMAARIIRVFSREHPGKMFFGCTHNMSEILKEVNVAKMGTASFGGNDNNLPRLHCERRPISASKLADLKRTVCFHSRQVS
jgi:hypothetical protein